VGYARVTVEIPDKEYVAAQGRCIGRNGRIKVKVDENGSVYVGGARKTGIDGTLNY